jgi:HAD superfamily hydrolase (TIGR01509 family)
LSFLISGLPGANVEIDAVLFDLFNTLVLIEGGEAFYIPSLKKLHQFLARNGVKVSFDDFKRVYFEIRDKLYIETQKNLEEPHFNVRISQTLERFGYGYGVSHPIVVGATEAFCYEFLRYTRLDGNAVNVLQKLRQSYKLGLISNFAIPEFVDIILNKFGLAGSFDIVVVSGAVNKRKPSPEIFEKALKPLGVEASRTVFVGDTLSVDVKGAKEAAMKAILIKREISPPADSISLVYRFPDEEAKVEPDRVIESLRELPNVLEDC